MTRLSNRQFPMLETFASGVYMNIEEAQYYDQRPFRSMLVHGWIAYKPGRGFHITPAGRKAHSEFHGTEIGRKDPTMPLTSLFDPTAYGVRKVQAMRGAA
jgi:hypothetical protein